jgi:hypothetical protein
MHASWACSSEKELNFRVIPNLLRRLSTTARFYPDFARHLEAGKTFSFVTFVT